MRPAVSILMPAYQAAATLAAAVESVQAQSWSDWELILADDGSTDGTWDLARGFGDPRIRPIHRPRSEGAAAARNHALDHATGRYIAFLDADDLWLPEKLARQIPFMAETGAALSYTGFLRRWPDGRERVVPVPDRVDRATLLRGNVIGCLTAIYDTERLGKVPMRPLRRRQDYALWLDILARVPEARGLMEPLAIYRVSPGSLSANRWAATRDTWRMYREAAGLTRAETAWCLSSHLWRRLIR